MLVYLENQLQVALSLFGEAVSKAHGNLISVEWRKEYIFLLIRHSVCAGGGGVMKKRSSSLPISDLYFSSTFLGVMNSEPFHYSNAN